MGFYSQEAYVPEWVDNTMLFLEVADVEQYWAELVVLDLPNKYKGVRVTPIRQEVWGKVGFVHDTSGILWNIGGFN